MPTRESISKRGKGPIRAEAEPNVTAKHAPIQISTGAGVTLVEQALESRFVDEKRGRYREH